MTTLEDLTKTQIILLTILVSFVTSIATGIITASLLASAPASVVQTINRVVEHTIEQNDPAATSTVVHDVTVVKEEDEITGAIESALPSVVRIMGPLPQGGDGFYGLGTILSKDGLVISESVGLSVDGTYVAILADGSTQSLKVAGMDEANGLVLWKIVPDTTHQSFISVPIAKADAKLGQSAIAIEGQSGSTVGVGRVTTLEQVGSPKDEVLTGLLTDIAGTGETAGSPLIDLSGELIGIKIPQKDYSLVPGEYEPLAAIRKLVSTATATS